MLIALLRHGPAEDTGPRTGWQDEPRELTDDGRVRIGAAARGISRLNLGIERIVTSPLVRCLETAQIVGDAIAVPPQTVTRLQPGLSAEVLLDVLHEHADATTVLVCGHQPDLSLVTAHLIDGGAVEFKKGALAVIDLDVLRQGEGFLRALYPPAALRALGGA